VSTHARWIAKQRHRHANFDEFKLNQCVNCGAYHSLDEKLGFDWGACDNSESPHDCQVVFEHFGCSEFK